MDRLPASRSGRRPAAEILFPEGSTDLVASVYRGDALMEHLQSATAAAIAGRVAAALARPDAPARLTLIEIGAGTGGTTAGLLEALAPFADRLSYIYTDLSPALVAHGRERFGGYGFVSFRPLDIASPAQETGIADIVIAANVLHATADIGATLRHAKRLLKAGGLLAALEAIAPRDFASLTFGLTPGWWAFADPDARLPGGPLLGRREWTRALAAAGFEAIACDELGVPGRGHALILGTSDGSLIADAIPALPTVSSAVPPAAASLVRMPATGGTDTVLAWLSETVAGILGLPAAVLDPAHPLDSYGVDSLMIPRITRALELDLGVRVPAAALFEHPTLNALAAHLAAARPEARNIRRGDDTPPAPDDALARFVTGLSDADVDALLAELSEGER